MKVVHFLLVAYFSLNGEVVVVPLPPIMNLTLLILTKFLVFDCYVTVQLTALAGKEPCLTFSMIHFVRRVMPIRLNSSIGTRTLHEIKELVTLKRVILPCVFKEMHHAT